MITIYLNTENLKRYYAGQPVAWSTTPQEGLIAVQLTMEAFNRLTSNKTILHG